MLRVSSTYKYTHHTFFLVSWLACRQNSTQMSTTLCPSDPSVLAIALRKQAARSLLRRSPCLKASRVRASPDDASSEDVAAAVAEAAVVGEALAAGVVLVVAVVVSLVGVVLVVHSINSSTAYHTG